MKLYFSKNNAVLSLLVLLLFISSSLTAQYTFSIDSNATNFSRVQYGVSILSKALTSIQNKKPQRFQIKIDTALTKKESFQITSKAGVTKITGADASGILYGCLSVVDSIQKNSKLPLHMNVSDAPEMVLRGTCIGVQKPYYLPERTVYEYPYTPETFPWFYDKTLWIKVLDSLLANRMNSLYLWNGHPFASLVKLKDYPYAVEVSEETFAKNEEIYKFITAEADKRGIWVIQMFYNIIVSKPFAAYHQIKTQDRNRPIIPLIADYTRKSIAAFVEKYPNVGLMVCLGEAMEGVGNDDIEWFTKTIIPGMKDGLKAIGKTTEPPIVLRAHDVDAPSVIKAAKPLYSNLYTEAKFNGEALTTYAPRGTWAELHRTLASLGSVQIENVHILANLEPFRYGATHFIQKSVQGMHQIMHGNGLHLYPQASYWDWPYTADSVKGKRLLQIERDWIWYKAWSRYAWKSDRDSVSEDIFWATTLASKFGTSKKNGAQILEAYNEAGQIAPKLLRRFGITDGNRQTLTLGMLMTQLINPYRYGLFDLLYDAESPVGEKLIEYAEKEWNHQPHIGETPIQIIHEVKAHAAKAVASIYQVSPTLQKEEFARIKNDVLCYEALANAYAEKATAALSVLRYKYSNDVKDLIAAIPSLEKSLVHYKRLIALTNDTYLYANSMQTAQRKIPMRGVNGTFKKWSEMLAPFTAELNRFKFVIDSLQQKASAKPPQDFIFKNEMVRIGLKEVWEEIDFYKVTENAKPYFDNSDTITAIAPSLKDLKGVRLSYQKQITEGTKIQFSNEQSIKVLVGYFNAKEKPYLKAPELETDASANDYGQSEILVANAVYIKGRPSINVHAYYFKPGNNTLTLAKGACLLLGFVPGNESYKPYDAGITEKGLKKEIDWLFE